MKKYNVLRKLSSRKFWAAVVGFVSPLMLAFGSTQTQVDQTAAIIMAGGSLVAYIVAEGFVDAKKGESTDGNTKEG